MKVLRYILSFLFVMVVTITAHNQETNRLESIAGGAFIVKAVYVDQDGVKWFGTNKGLCRYDDLTWRYYTDADFLVGNQVNALAYEQTEYGPELWVATTDGVSVVAYDADGVTGSTSYTTEEGILNNEVNDIVIDSRHGKFFGSKDGITWFHDGVMDSLVFAEYYPYILSTPIRQMDIRNDTIYMAQDGGIGRLVSGVDGITGASRWTSEYGVSPYSGDIYSLELSESDYKYFGCDVGVETHSGSFAKENWDLLSSDNGLVNNHVISIAEDGEGGMWFGTLGGVSYLADEVWTSYTSADGLLNDTVYSIDFDLDGSVWFATGAGACNLKDGVFQDYITVVPERIVSVAQFQVFFNNVSGSINLSYALKQSVPVSARLYNISGIMVGVWSDLPSQSGLNSIELPVNLPSASGPQQGIYILQLMQGNASLSRKLLIAH